MIPECWPKTRRSGVHAATILPYVIFFFFGGGGAGFGNASYWAKRDMAEMVSADPKRQVINGRVQSTSLQQLCTYQITGGGARSVRTLKSILNRRWRGVVGPGEWAKG